MKFQCLFFLICDRFASTSECKIILTANNGYWIYISTFKLTIVKNGYIFTKIQYFIAPLLMSSVILSAISTSGFIFSRPMAISSVTFCKLVASARSPSKRHFLGIYLMLFTASGDIASKNSLSVQWTLPHSVSPGLDISALLLALNSALLCEHSY